MLATILAARPPPQHVLVPGARFDMGWERPGQRHVANFPTGTCAALAPARCAPRLPAHLLDSNALKNLSLAPSTEWK